MITLLEAIRLRLVSDPILAVFVHVINISTTYRKTLAELSSIVFNISSKRLSPLSGVTSVVVSIDVRSGVNKDKAWEIYDRLEVLLNDRPYEISTATCLIHSFTEIEVNDRSFDQVSNAWLISSQYSVVFSDSSTLVLSGAIGQIYADGSAVHVHNDHLIADFNGMVSVYTDFEKIDRTNLNRFKTDSIYHIGNVSVYVTNVQFKFASINQLWSITYSASGFLNDGITSAKSYQINQTSTPKELQLLFHGTRTDTGKQFEIFCPKVILPVMTIQFPRKEIALLDYRFICMGDANNNLVSFSTEN